MKYLVVFAAIVVISISCGKPIKDVEADHVGPYEFETQYIKNSWNRSENSEVICYSSSNYKGISCKWKR